MREPLRERWPLWPRAEVLPMPEPIPRPTRLRFSDAFFGARTVERFMTHFLGNAQRSKYCNVPSIATFRVLQRSEYCNVPSIAPSSAGFYYGNKMRHLRHHASNLVRVL